LKLENILLYKNKSEAKIADFGFASDNSQNLDQKNKWSNRCKTMLAPEILSLIKSNTVRNEPFDETKSDIFALGVTLF
jgi:serine/threonine protein kinase